MNDGPRLERVGEGGPSKIYLTAPEMSKRSSWEPDTYRIYFGRKDKHDPNDSVSCDIAESTNHISRRHATITLERCPPGHDRNWRALIRDGFDNDSGVTTPSTNGTFVNNVRCGHESHWPLRNGDFISLGGLPSERGAVCFYVVLEDPKDQTRDSCTAVFNSFHCDESSSDDGNSEGDDDYARTRENDGGDTTKGYTIDPFLVNSRPSSPLHALPSRSRGNHEGLGGEMPFMGCGEESRRAAALSHTQEESVEEYDVPPSGDAPTVATASLNSKKRSGEGNSIGIEDNIVGKVPSIDRPSSPAESATEFVFDYDVSPSQPQQEQQQQRRKSLGRTLSQDRKSCDNVRPPPLPPSQVESIHEFESSQPLSTPTLSPAPPSPHSRRGGGDGGGGGNTVSAIATNDSSADQQRCHRRGVPSSDDFACPLPFSPPAVSVVIPTAAPITPLLRETDDASSLMGGLGATAATTTPATTVTSSAAIDSTPALSAGDPGPDYLHSRHRESSSPPAETATDLVLDSQAAGEVLGCHDAFSFVDDNHSSAEESLSSSSSSSSASISYSATPVIRMMDEEQGRCSPRPHHHRRRQKTPGADEDCSSGDEAGDKGTKNHESAMDGSSLSPSSDFIRHHHNNEDSCASSIVVFTQGATQGGPSLSSSSQQRNGWSSNKGGGNGGLNDSSSGGGRGAFATQEVTTNESMLFGDSFVSSQATSQPVSQQQQQQQQENCRKRTCLGLKVSSTSVVCGVPAGAVVASNGYGGGSGGGPLSFRYTCATQPFNAQVDSTAVDTIEATVRSARAYAETNWKAGGRASAVMPLFRTWLNLAQNKVGSR
mmetsp:Transcript_37323/g.75652  ORF Transcript_37323/g.75652 Transcript_37323/m.75652 type:complete len:827 (+) Transcript_37323:100-2580(+)